MKKQKKSAWGSVMNNTFLLFYSLKPLEPSMNFYIWKLVCYKLHFIDLRLFINNDLPFRIWTVRYGGRSVFVYCECSGRLGQYLASTGFSVRVFTHLGVNVFHFNRPYDTRHLCMHPRIDGIFAMSRDFSGDEQWIEFAITSNRGGICLFYQNETTM